LSPPPSHQCNLFIHSSKSCHQLFKNGSLNIQHRYSLTTNLIHHTPVDIPNTPNRVPVPNTFYQNCRGLRFKLTIFKYNVALFNYVFICLTDTWLCESIGDNELGLENYVIFRYDRNLSTSRLRRGGGTLIFVGKDIRCLRISPTSTNVEHLFVKFSTQNISFILSLVYVPPSSPFTLYESHVPSVQTIALANSNCTFIFCEDFSLPDISWANDNYALLYSSPSSHCLPESFSYLNLFQINNVSKNQCKHLDLVFSNNNNICIEKYSSNVVPCDSYHPALDISLPIIADTPSLDKSHIYFNL